MKYYKGQRLRIKSEGDILATLEGGDGPNNIYWNDHMTDHRGKVATVTTIETSRYDMVYSIGFKELNTHSDWIFDPAWVEKVDELPEELFTL